MTNTKAQMSNEYQITNNKTYVLKFVIWLLDFNCHLNFVICHYYLLGSMITLSESFASATNRNPFPVSARPSLCVIISNVHFFRLNKPKRLFMLFGARR